MRDLGRVLDKISDIIPAPGKQSLSVLLPGPPWSPRGKPSSRGAGRGARLHVAPSRTGPYGADPPSRAERRVRRGARGGARGGAGGPAPPQPARGCPEGTSRPVQISEPRAAVAPPSRRLRARLPAPGSEMGAAPCGAAPAPPRPFRPREPARYPDTAGVPQPAAGLALLGGPGPGEVSSAPWRNPNSGVCRTSLWTRYIHKTSNT